VPGVKVDYEPNLSVYSLTKGVVCSPIIKGHSGRGGGYTQVGWSCAETLKKALAPKASVSLFSGHPLSDAEVAVRLGTLDRDPGIRPQYRQFVESAAAWEPLPEDGLPRHARARGAQA
jgi:hypothetical protein